MCAGRLVSLRGTVVRVSGIRPLILQMDFACARCGAVTTCRFPDGKYTPPQARRRWCSSPWRRACAVQVSCSAQTWHAAVLVQAYSSSGAPFYLYLSNWGTTLWLNF